MKRFVAGMLALAAPLLPAVVAAAPAAQPSAVQQGLGAIAILGLVIVRVFFFWGIAAIPLAIVATALTIVLAVSAIEAVCVTWAVLGLAAKGLGHWLLRPLAASALAAASTVGLSLLNGRWAFGGLEDASLSAANLLFLVPAALCVPGLAVAGWRAAARGCTPLKSRPGAIVRWWLARLATIAGTGIASAMGVAGLYLLLAYRAVSDVPDLPALPWWPVLVLGVLAVPGLVAAVALWRVSRALDAGSDGRASA